MDSPTPLEQIREKYEKTYRQGGSDVRIGIVELLKDLRAGAALEYWLAQGAHLSPPFARTESGN